MTFEPTDEDIAAAADKAKLLDSAAMKMGLYQQDVKLVASPNGGLVLVCDFLLGDVAFSPRVQDPAKDKLLDELAGIEQATAERTVEDYMDELRKKHSDDS